MKKLNIDESIQKQKLIFEEGWEDKIDCYFVYFVFLAVIFSLISLVGIANFNNTNDKAFLYFISPIILLFSIYIIYRKATEKQLIKLNTSFGRKKNRQILIDYAINQNLEIYRSSLDCLILNQKMDVINNLYVKSIIILVSHNEVHFTILKSHPRISIPAITSHLFLKYELKKLFQ